MKGAKYHPGKSGHPKIIITSYEREKECGILEGLVILGDMIVTHQNTLSSKGLFIAEILGWIIVLICDIVITVFFHVIALQKPNQFGVMKAMVRLVMKISILRKSY